MSNGKSQGFDGDRIELSGLQIRGSHGVFEHEKRDGQTFVVDLVVWLSLDAAARSDDLADTLDYAALAATAERIVGGPARDLIEAVAGELCTALLDENRQLRAVQVRLHKPHAPIPATFADVAVVITKRRVLE